MVLVLLSGVPAALAAFTSTSSASNTISTDTDWTRPTVDRTVIAKSTGYLANSVKQGGTYYVYANITDTGNPASGMSGGSAGVSTDVQTVTTGQSNVTLSSASGPWTVQGQSYNYRSAQLTVSNPRTEGSKAYTITPTDTDGNSGVASGYSVTVDNTQPTSSDIQTANKTGGSSGVAEIGDTISFTFSEQIDPQSILAGWTGASTNVIVRLQDGGCVLNLLVKICADDSFEVYNGASPLATLGPVDLKDPDYLGGGLLGAVPDAVFGSSGTASTMVQSGASIIITLGTRSGSSPDQGGTTTTEWDSATSPYDAAGNAATGNTRTETGGGDREF
jgi:hypothetical protein